MFVAAIAQALVPMIALGAGMHLAGRTPPVGTFLMLHVVFVALFAGSACVFQRAAADNPSDPQALPA